MVLHRLRALILAAALVPLSSTAASAAEAPPTPTEQLDIAPNAALASVYDVKAYVTCKGGTISWNASYNGQARTTYNVFAMLNTDGGGDYDWQYKGVTSTGSLGIGSTNTYTTYRPGETFAKVDVKIGDGVGSATTNCV